MPHQSKTYSLSDEVIEAIEALRSKGETPNQIFRRLLGLDKPATDHRTPKREIREKEDKGR